MIINISLIIGVSRDEVLEKNYEKLSKRYSDGSYSNNQAQKRMDKVLESIEENFSIGDSK
jgi:hypothetical protein